MSEPSTKTLRFTVADKAIEPSETDFYLYAEYPDGFRVQVHSLDACEAIDDQMRRDFARLSLQFQMAELSDKKLKNVKLRIDGNDMDVKPKLEDVQ